jgi:SecD/SecF fusion protein
MYVLVVLGLLAASIVVIAVKPTVLGLDLKGGAQVILQASPTANAEVNDDSMRRAINVIRNRVDAFGVSEPEIQKQGTDQISVALPAVEDPAVILDLVKPAQLNFYAFQPNLVDYQRYPAPASTVNPPDGTTDLYGLIQLAKGTEPKPGSQETAGVYLFRKNAAHTYIAGPSPSIDELVKRLEAAPETQAVAAEYKANKKAFDVQVLPKGFVILTNGEGAGSDLASLPLCGQGGNCILLHDVVGVAGSEVKGANLGFDAANNPTVQMQFTGTGRDKFAQITKQIVDGAIGEGRPCASANDSSCFWNFAISLDGVMISNPYVSYKDNPSGIDSDTAEISGGFTESSARTLADQLSSGAIPIKLDAVSTSTVSATLGEQSLRQGLIAGIIGLILVMIALIAYYRVLGVIASASLIIYGIYFWALAKLIPIALTLPGIAGLILTIGVAADASVVIFERVREESRAGRPPRSAILNGYKRGITAIIDANIVTLVTAVFIFLLSTAGPRGFAFTLILGVLLSLFTAVVATQGAFGLLVGTKLFENERLMGLNVREIKWKMDVVGRWKLWLGISFFPLLLGVLIIGLRGLEPGLDFKSGTEVRVAWAQPTATENAIRDELQALGVNDPKIQRYEPQGTSTRLTGFEIQTATLDAAKTSQVLDRLEAKFGTIDEQQITSVGPTFGRDIVRNAIWAVVFSFLAIIAYLTIRFEYKLALPAMASVIHDVWLVLAIYSIAGKEVTGATVAALLTILGYSLYDVVILFDRIRENLPLMRGRPYRDIVNRSVHETLTRSIITMVLTLLPILCLLLFGGETLSDFSFALFVGILSGGVSSIFISAPLAALWKEREPDAKRARARSERKAARAAMVDADIMDVDALARAEKALALSAPATPPSTATVPGVLPDEVDLVEIDDEVTDAATPNGRLELEAEADGQSGDELPDVEDDGAPAEEDEPPAEEPKPPPDRQRRHRNVQRKRRR